MNSIEKDESVALTGQQARLTSKSGIALYRERFHAAGGWLALLRYELTQALFGRVPGLMGFGLRSVCYGGLFRSCGSRPAFGVGVALANPRNISLGKRVLIDDYVALTAGAEAEIHLGDYVSIGRFSILAAKGTKLYLGAGVNVGTHCRLASQSEIVVGESTLIAAYCYIGPGNHERNSEGRFIDGEMEVKGGVSIGEHCWIGTRATILDGVTIGNGAVVGAHSLVVEDVPAHTVVAGTPAKVIRQLVHPKEGADG